MKQLRQSFLMIAGIVLVSLVGLFAINISRALTILPGNTTIPGLADLPVSQTDDSAPIIGSPQADLTVVEFLDYSCYHCATLQPTINTLLETYVATGKARLEIRTLDNLDPVGSTTATQAAICAEKQNAFLPMHLRLLALQLQYGRSAFSLDHIQQAANHLDIDSNMLLRCIQNQTDYETIQTNMIAAAQLAKVQTLPAFLLQTEEDTSLHSAENIMAAIESALTP